MSDSEATCPTCDGPVDYVEQDRFEGGFPNDPTMVHVKVPVCRSGRCRSVQLRAAAQDGRALHHVSARADPRNEGTAAFYERLAEDIRERHGELRRIVIRGIGTLVDPEVNLPYLREYAVSYVVAEGVPGP